MTAPGRQRHNHGGWILALLLPACSEAPANRFDIAGHHYDSVHATHLALPKALREISGLELAPGGRLYAHNDEKGVIYEIDYRAPRVQAIELTGDTDAEVRDDFEGIASLGRALFLVTSRGRLYETRIDEARTDGAGISDTPDGATVLRHPGGIDCEVEGLTAAPDGASLLVACKNLPDGETGIRIHAWDPRRQAYAAAPALIVSSETVTDFLLERFPERPPPKRIQPTGITITGSGNLLLVAARQYLLLEFTVEGVPVAAALLDPAVHRQAEGIVLDAEGRLFVASEGDGRGDKKTPGVLSVYEPID